VEEPTGNLGEHLEANSSAMILRGVVTEETEESFTNTGKNYAIVFFSSFGLLKTIRDLRH